MSLKSILKNNKAFMRLYDKLLPYYCIYFTKPAMKMLYKQTFQRPLDLENPRDLNQKIQWLKVYAYKNNPLVSKCADKYRVREYVRELGCEEIMNELNLNNPNEIRELSKVLNKLEKEGKIYRTKNDKFMLFKYCHLKNGKLEEYEL